MIKILLVEDNNEKAIVIGNHIRSTYPVEVVSVVTCSDTNSARRNLSDQFFDVLILDIQVPTTFDRAPDPTGGIQLIKNITNSGRYLHPTHVIALTAYAESAELAAGDLSLSLVHVLSYSASNDQWKAKLSSMLDGIIKANAAANAAPSLSYGVDVAVVCALHDPELKAVLDLPWNWVEETRPGDSTNYWRGQARSVQVSAELSIVACHSPTMGMTSCSVLCSKVIQHFRPRFIVMPGIAAGIRGNANIGDVLVAEHTWDYSSGKWAEDADGILAFQPDPRPLALDSTIRDWFQLLSHNSTALDAIRRSWRGPKCNSNTLSVLVGPFASGPAVVATRHITQEIRTHARKLLGIDMEAYSVFYTASNALRPRPTAISIKAVSDFADSDKSSDGTAVSQAYASFASAQILNEFVCSCPEILAGSQKQ